MADSVPVGDISPLDTEDKKLSRASVRVICSICMIWSSPPQRMHEIMEADLFCQTNSLPACRHYSFFSKHRIGGQRILILLRSLAFRRFLI